MVHPPLSKTTTSNHDTTISPNASPSTDTNTANNTATPLSSAATTTQDIDEITQDIRDTQGIGDTQLLVETALMRAFRYLQSSGVVITKTISLTVLRLIDELLSTNQPDLLAKMMQKLPEHIALPHPQLPPSFPKIQRASIGYDQR